MTRAVVLSLATAFAAAMPASAQRVTIVDRGAGQAAALVDSVTSAPHVLRAGSGPLVLPRDSTVTTSLLVLGRPTYLASKVQGDVVVVGGDLFLRPGAEITGRAVAIGGTVAGTTLGHVGGTIESLRDETFAVDGGATGYTLTARSLRVGGDTLSDSLRLFRLAGIRGLLIPRYDRVDGLSLPLGVQVNLARQQLLLQPTVTYRSRLGVLDPGVSLRVGPEEGTRFEGRVARDTRSNDLWITSELINSLKTLAFGTDTRNYFRSDIAEGRLFVRTGGGGESKGATLEPFIGARAERVSSISATGDVFSFIGRTDDEKIRRPNPTVEQGTIGSALLGLLYQSAPDNVTLISRLYLEAEQGVTTPVGTSTFTQLTADGRVEFPTFGLQRLRFRGHAVATRGDSVPRARYAYLGGSRTLGLSELLEYGGAALVFVESRYLIPVPSFQLPLVGPPTLVLIHRMGGAGVRSISPLQQEVGAGLSLGPIDLELITGASGQHKTEFGVGVSLPAF